MATGLQRELAALLFEARFNATLCFIRSERIFQRIVTESIERFFIGCLLGSVECFRERIIFYIRREGGLKSQCLLVGRCRGLIRQQFVEAPGVDRLVAISRLVIIVRGI